jgi:hypothetical protein
MPLPSTPQERPSITSGTEPESSPAKPTPEPELTRRQLLQRRMPARGRLQEIVDRGQCVNDPWLDDEED